jgi:hypothetical protein
MANTVAVTVDTDEIGVRFQKLNLPPRPLIMEKSNRPCTTHQNQNTPCFCFEYTTLLDRPEYTGKYLRESPEPEVRTPKLTNGTPNPAKRRIKLGEYLGKTSTPKIEQRSLETSPNNATNAPTRSTQSSTTTHHPKSSVSRTPTHTPASKPSSTPSSERSRMPKASIPAKRYAEAS